jgi:hypothetical protein
VAVAEVDGIVGVRRGRILVDVGQYERGRTVLTQVTGDEATGVAAVQVDQAAFGALMGRLVPLGAV